MTAPAKNSWYAHSFSWRFMLALPSPFAIFLLLIVNYGMDAVSFADYYAMRPFFLSCTDIILFLHIWLLDDGSESMTVFIFLIFGCCWGGVFLFALPEVLFLVALLQLIHSLEPFWAIFWLQYPTVVMIPGFCRQGLIEGLQWHDVWIEPCLIFFPLQLMPLYL